jgi:hypothetical protein
MIYIKVVTKDVVRCSIFNVLVLQVILSQLAPSCCLMSGMQLCKLHYPLPLFSLKMFTGPWLSTAATAPRTSLQNDFWRQMDLKIRIRTVLDSVAGMCCAFQTISASAESLVYLRICPGLQLASNSIFIMIASVLSVFHISKQKDELGKEIPVHPSFVWDGLVRYVSAFCPSRLALWSICTSYSHPEPFKCSFSPRSAAAVDLFKPGPST